MKEFVKKYSNVFAIFILFIVCVLVYFWGIGAYPLMDVDETRYVSIAKHMFLSKDYSICIIINFRGVFYREKNSVIEIWFNFSISFSNFS